MEATLGEKSAQFLLTFFLDYIMLHYKQKIDLVSTQRLLPSNNLYLQAPKVSRSPRSQRGS